VGSGGDGVVTDVATREQQAEWFDAYADAAPAVLMSYIEQHAPFLLDLARERLLGIGFDEYGDAMWQQSRPETRREIAEEIADALNRVVVLLRGIVEPAPSD
jgi:hypothetical protein